MQRHIENRNEERKCMKTKKNKEAKGTKKPTETKCMWRRFHNACVEVPGEENGKNGIQFLKL
jgi:hypothetical protein